MTIRKTAAMAALLLLGAATVSVYGQEAGINPARGAAAAAQAAAEANYPKLNVNIQYLQLAIPGQTMGETMGVDTNSKGHLFVYTRTENQGIARGGKAATLFEFDDKYKFVKEWGMNNYSESFAHEVKVDKQDNVWSVDEGSGMIVKFNPQGQHIFWLGRTPEAIDYLESNLEILHYAHAAQAAPPKPVGRMGTFDRETGIAWDKAGNIFVSDGYGNSRFVKISPDGHWLKAVGTNGSGPNQFSTPHDIAVDANDNVYVADRGNNRIQVYDDNMNFEKSITGVAAPWALCFSESSPQVMYSGDGTGKIYRVDPASGRVTGMFITGQDHGTEDTGNLVHSLSCKNPNTVFVGSASMWDVQKVTVR
jgi:streptogramin lyase